MAGSAEDIKNELMEQTALQVAVVLKTQYKVIRKVLAITQPPVDIAENVTDAEFTAMANKAISERKLYVKLADGKEQAIEFQDINAHILQLPEDARGKLGGDNFDINNLIPKEETLQKVAQATFDAAEEKKGFDFGILISAILNWISNGFDWEKAKAEAAAPNVQSNVQDHLDELAGKDPAVDAFLNQKSGSEQTVQQKIQSRVPAEVYTHLQQPVPENLKVKEEHIDLAKVEQLPEPTIDTQKNIAEIRKKALYKDEGGTSVSRADEIVDKLFAGFNKKIAQATQADNESTFGALGTTSKVTSKLVLHDNDDGDVQKARKFSDNVLNVVAKVFENVVKDPKVAAMKPEDLSIYIDAKLAEELDKNKDKLRITKITDSWLVGGMKNTFWEDDLPKTTGKDNEYIIVDMDTKVDGDKGKQITVKQQIIEQVHQEINENTFKQLTVASGIIARERLEKAKECASALKLPAVQQCTPEQIGGLKPANTNTKPAETKDKSK